MQTAAFESALVELLRLAGQQRTAIMCAEAVPWRCHRSLVADALTVRGVPINHIRSIAHPRPHKLNPLAYVEGEKVTYPATPA